MPTYTVIEITLKDGTRKQKKKHLDNVDIFLLLNV